MAAVGNDHLLKALKCVKAKVINFFGRNVALKIAHFKQAQRAVAGGKIKN